VTLSFLSSLSLRAYGPFLYSMLGPFPLSFQNLITSGFLLLIFPIFYFLLLGPFARLVSSRSFSSFALSSAHCCALILSFVLPFAHRFSRRLMARCLHFYERHSLFVPSCLFFFTTTAWLLRWSPAFGSGSVYQQSIGPKPPNTLFI